MKKIRNIKKNALDKYLRDRDECLKREAKTKEGKKGGQVLMKIMRGVKCFCYQREVQNVNEKIITNENVKYKI